MGFLKKLGTVLLKGTQILVGVTPLLSGKAQAVAGVVKSELDELLQVIMYAEAFGQALGVAGADKLKAAAGPVSQIILHSSIMAGRKIQDPAKFQAACGTIAGGLADLLNSLDDDVKTEDKA